MEKPAKEEREYNEEEILREIEPLLKEFFIAQFRKTHAGINMTLPNGQKFVISICKT